MLTLQGLKALVQQRLTAAVDEVFVDLEKTFTEYEEEIRRQRRLLDLLTQSQNLTQNQSLTQGLNQNQSLSQNQTEIQSLTQIQNLTTPAQKQVCEKDEAPLKHWSSDGSVSVKTEDQRGPDQDQDQDHEGPFKEEETPPGNELSVDCDGLDLNGTSPDLDYDRLMLLVESSVSEASQRDEDSEQSLSSAQSGARNDLNRSEGTSSLFSLKTSDAWIQNFRVPWERVPPSLSDSISHGERATGADRRALVRAVVDAMRQHCPRPNRAACVGIAKLIVSDYPLTFADRTEEGEQLGTGYFSLLNQIKTRVENLNRGRITERKRKPRLDSSQTSTKSSPKKRIKVDSYGCINWQPKSLPENETNASLQKKRQKMVNLYETAGANTSEMPQIVQFMSLTYVLQRQTINSSPSLNVASVQAQWPFLFTKTGVCDHFQTLTGVAILERMQEALQNKGKRIRSYFWRHAQNRDAQRVLDEMETREMDSRRTGIGAVVLLMKHFLEKEEAIFVLAEPQATKTSVQNDMTLPVTPRIIAFGDSLLSSTRWMVSLDRTVAFVLDDNSSFSDALSVFFACFYVFNLEYEEPACATLELIQRYLVRINPEEGTKCTAKTGVSRKTGETVTRKSETVNSRVASFLRQLLESDLKN